MAWSLHTALTMVLQLTVAATAAVALNRRLLQDSSNPSDPAFWERKAVEYAPQYKFHPDESIWPITIDDFLTHVESNGGYDEGGTWHTIQEGPITPDSLDPLLNTGDVRLAWDKTYMYIGEGVDEDTDWVTDSSRSPANGGSPKVYTVIYDPTPDDMNGFVEIQYWLFYPYNHVPSLFGGIGDFFAPCESIDHFTDLVAIVIRFSKTGEPQRIWYAQHGDGPVWAWSQGSEWDQDDDQKFSYATFKGGPHPIVYVSQGNHEHYPYAGTYNMGNDFCSNDGVWWAPTDNPQSSFEFVHVRKPMSGNSPANELAEIFQGRNKWMAYNGKLAGDGGCVTGVNSIAKQKNQGSFTEHERSE